MLTRETNPNAMSVTQFFTLENSNSKFFNDNCTNIGDSAYQQQALIFSIKYRHL